MQRANVEKWQDLRNQATIKSITETKQKTAEKAADNATLAADIKKRLWMRLKRIEEKYPLDATEVRSKVGNSQAVYRIRDLTAAYRDLTADMVQTEEAGNELLQSLIALERGSAQ